MAVGNAPTALFRLLELIEAGRAAARGRDRRAGRASSARRSRRPSSPRHPSGLEYLVVHGRRGGSAIAAAAVNALASDSE